MRVLAFLSLALTICTGAALGQSDESGRTKSSVAAFVRDNDEEAGIVRRRVASEDKGAAGSTDANPKDLASSEHKLFELINAKRAEFGLAPIAWSDDVAKIARLHSENMAKFNFFSHRGLDGKMVDGRADSLGVSKWTAMGENIAYNRGFKMPLETAVVKWLESPSHRENMLSPRWKEGGLGIAVTADGTYYFTQVFILRR